MTSKWIRTRLLLSRWVAFSRSGKFPHLKFTYEPILGSELFNADQMASHGIALASQHQRSAWSSHDALLGRLDDNETLLRHSCPTAA